MEAERTVAGLKTVFGTRMLFPKDATPSSTLLSSKPPCREQEHRSGAGSQDDGQFDPGSHGLLLTLIGGGNSSATTLLND